VVFARMAVSYVSAKMDLSSKFGASPAEIPAGAVSSFTVYGPTCDASDVLPAPVELPDVQSEIASAG